MPGAAITGGKLGIIVPTTLQLAADTMRWFTSLTCLYDRYWEPSTGDVTFPIAFMHVTKFSKVVTKETSKKRVILYEPSKGLMPVHMEDRMREGAMQTIVDNVVKQPNQYNIEAIVPFQPVGRYFTEGLSTFSGMLAFIAEMTGGGGTIATFGGSALNANGDNLDSSWSFDSLASTLSGIQSVVKYANTALNIAGMYPGMQGMNQINKNSLDAMAESPHVLCMKMWTGYEYKFVEITQYTDDKRPLEDDVYRVSMQVQEMPILQVTKPEVLPVVGASLSGATVKLVTAAFAKLVLPLTTLTRVKVAAEGDADMAGKLGL
jgi:hypothetical protein